MQLRAVCLVLVVAVTMVACDDAPQAPAAAQYAGERVSFRYPEGWTLTDDSKALIQTITVESSGSPIAIVQAFPPELELAWVRETAWSTMRSNMESSGVTIDEARSGLPVERIIGGRKVEGRILVGTALIVTTTVEIFATTLGSRHVVLLLQSSDDERNAAEPAWQMLTESIAAR